MMKKTLVALAALAATGAFAQVSLTGEFAYGYQATSNGAGATASGGGLDTAQLVFGVSEDLGGGNKVDVTMKTDGATGSRGGALVNDDQTIALTTGFGKITMGSWKPADWLTSTTAGATWYGLDDRVLSKRSYRDSIGIAVPVTSAVTLSATAYEPAGAVGEGSGNAGTAAQQANVYGLTYKSGALVVNAGYVTYNNVGAFDNTFKNVSRVSFNYDLGVAKIGAGTQVGSLGGGGTNTQNLVSVSVPAGNLSFNAEWASNNYDVATTSVLYPAAGNHTGYMLGAQYNVSKRTYAILNYGSWLGTTANAAGIPVNDGQNSNLTALTLVHDF